MEQPDYNLYIRCIEVRETRREGDKYITDIVVQVKTIKEGRIREKLILRSATEDSKKMEVSEGDKNLAQEV